ncbi:MAG: glycosyltransferase [Myxococcota bacterium]
MYLVGTHIPVYVDGDRRFVDDSWYADLVLKKQFLAPVFGEIHMIGPRLQAADAGDAILQEVDDPELHVHASEVSARTRLRHWRPAARQWARELEPLIARATVVHASVDDPFRPMQLATLRAGWAARKPTVVIGFDMDVWDVLPDKLKTMSVPGKALHVARTSGMDAWMRVAVRRGSVAMLKEGLVYDRYHRIAKNPKAFCHSMHSERYLVPDATFEARVASLVTGRPLRFGYFGRMIERKGLADAIRVLAAARAQGVDASYELIGWGPQQEELEALARSLGVAEHVSFPGSFPYGEALHERLRQLDGLLFTPTEEDTPRMVYDAYAAGLPILGTDIFFLRRRVERDDAGELFGIGDVEAGARLLVDLDGNRERFAEMARQAKVAGHHHTIETWYGRRVAWTREAVEAHGLRAA